MSIKKLEKLWSLAESEEKRRKSPFSHVFEPLGLILFRPMEREQYESTPINSLAFATTGGDGVHFSFVLQNGEISDQSPVVMTVPMNYGFENLIVGSDFEDFLSLGCEVGYSFLELLTYSDKRPEAIHWLTHPDEWFINLSSDPDNVASLDIKKILLKLIRSEFDVSPWDSIEEKLYSLEGKYLSLLELKSN